MRKFLILGAAAACLLAVPAAAGELRAQSTEFSSQGVYIGTPGVGVRVGPDRRDRHRHGYWRDRDVRGGLQDRDGARDAAGRHARIAHTLELLISLRVRNADQPGPLAGAISFVPVDFCYNGRVERAGGGSLSKPTGSTGGTSWLCASLPLRYCGLLRSSPPPAQDYPARQVRLIVPFGAGGPADVYARVIAQHLSEQLKQTFVVENRPGAGSIIGTDAVAKSAPDGYTLLVMSNTHTTNESLVASKPFRLMQDFVPVATLNYSDLIMVVHPSVAAKDLKEFIALAKAQPGGLNYASSGAGTPYHMAGELFKAMSGTDIQHVPHKASGEARNAVIGGHVQMMFDAITTMAPNAAAGQVRALGTTGTKRSALTPDVPTVAEAGVPGYEATIWLGVMAPAGTPKPIVDKLNAEINKVIERPDVKEAWAKQGAVPMVMSPAEFDKYLRDDIEKWAKVVQQSGIKAN